MKTSYTALLLGCYSISLCGNYAAEITRFAPLVIMDAEEKYFPCSVPWFVDKCSLRKRKGNSSELIAQKVTPSQLGQYGSDEFFLDLPTDEKLYLGEPLVNGAIVAPCYAHAVTKPDGLIIQYFFFYSFNGTFQLGVPVIGKIVGLVTKTFDIGTHKGDWEHITVTLNKTGQGYEIKDVYYARHVASKDGSYEKPELFESTHPIVYSSKYGHASHAHHAKLQKNGDKTSNNGPRWQTWKNVIDIGSPDKPTPGNEWVKFGGRWGSADAPPGPAFQPSWRSKNGQESKTLAKTQVTIKKDNKGVTSGNFEIQDNDVKTFYRKLLWKSNVADQSLKNDFTADVFTGRKQKLFSIKSPQTTTDIKKGKMRLEDCKFTKAPKNDVKVDVSVVGLYD